MVLTTGNAWFAAFALSFRPQKGRLCYRTSTKLSRKRMQDPEEADVISEEGPTATIGSLAALLPAAINTYRRSFWTGKQARGLTCLYRSGRRHRQRPYKSKRGYLATPLCKSDVVDTIAQSTKEQNDMDTTTGQGTLNVRRLYPASDGWSRNGKRKRRRGSGQIRRDHEEPPIGTECHANRCQHVNGNLYVVFHELRYEVAAHKEENRDLTAIMNAKQRQIQDAEARIRVIFVLLYFSGIRPPSPSQLSLGTSHECAVEF